MNKTWNTLIIDDESLARQRLKRLLTKYDLINLIGEAANGVEGLDMVENLQPDLIFLDIEMPGLNGFEMLSRLSKQPKVIFTTAYDQYAVKAFEEESLDYLLKPIEAERLEKSINKLNQFTQAPTSPFPMDALMNLLHTKKEIKTLTVKLGDRILLIKLTELVFIEAEDKYVFLNTIDGKKHLSDFTIAALEEKLPALFIRVNRSTIVNTDFIKEIRKGFNGAYFFILNDVLNTKINSSRGYGPALKAQFDL